jgi:nucleoside-diphosphate-sugar epimerase
MKSGCDGPWDRFAYAGNMDEAFLIAGCGYTGLRLAERLGSRGPVTALARSELAVARLRAEGIEPLRVDLDVGTAQGTLAAAADGAAIAYLVPPPESGDSDPRLQRFLDALEPGRPRVLLYMSTTGVYGDVRGAVVTEASPTLPSNERARRRLAAERLAQDWCAARGVRCSVLRVPGIYGPGRLPLERLRRGEPALDPADAGPGNRIHVDDLVAACIAALERPVQGIFNVTDGDPSSTTVFLQRTAALAGLPPPPLVGLAEATGRISPGMLAFLVESRRVDNRRMREELGVEPRYATLDEGIAASLAGMDANAG